MSNQHSPVEAERRPIASREAGWAQSIARGLARTRISPNSISVLGMVCGIHAGVMLAMTADPRWSEAAFLAAAVFVQLRLLANLFDGMVAVEQNRRSSLGELFNEVPDRISDVATLTGAGYALGGSPTLGFITAIMAVFLAYIRVQGKLAGAPMDYCGPMAKPHRMAMITAASLVAVVMLLSGKSVAASCLFQWGNVQVGVMFLALGIMLLGEVVTAFRRLSRIARAVSSEDRTVSPPKE